MTDIDVAVVGGGSSGPVARELVARSPGTSVTVLDRDLVGSGASRRSAGLHLPRGATPRIRAMARTSHDYYERLAAGNPSLPIYPLDMSVLATDAAEVDRVYLGRAALTPRSEVPDNRVGRPDGTGVWAGTGCHYTDVGALVGALAGMLRPGVRIWEATAVTGIEPGEDQVVLRLGSGGVLRANTVVLAPGPWVHAPAWRTMVEPLGLRVKLVVALHVDQVPTGRDRLIVFQDPDAFLLPMVHRGHWLFSHTSQQWDVRPEALTEGMTAAILAEARDALGSCAPWLVELATAGRVFCDAYSPGREPLVRALDREGRVVFAGAANGSGYRLAPAIAAEVATLLLGPPTRSASDQNRGSTHARQPLQSR
jgi:glycine/D-amino acid oxidase-like deaminating enzyme